MKVSTYLAGAVIVWTGILTASALLLAGTPYFVPLLLILGGGAVWFVVIVPGAMQTRRSDPAPSTGLGGTAAPPDAG